jgi:hypothetical protein
MPNERKERPEVSACCDAATLVSAYKVEWSTCRTRRFRMNVGFVFQLA